MGSASRFKMLLTAPFPSLIHRPSSVSFLHPLKRCLSISTSPCLFTLSFLKSSHQRLHIKSQSLLHEPSTSSPQKGPHPWPEWSHLISNIFSLGQQFPATEAHLLLPEDAFVTFEEKELSDEFIRGASACLAFARSHPHLLGLLARKDIEIIVSSGTPFIFKTALATARRMRAFLGLDVLESEKPSTVDIMKYMLSYASNPLGPSAHGSLYSRELVESSVRNLLLQMTEISFGNPAKNLPASDQYHFSGGFHQPPRPRRQNVEMKRGDWICPKCSFMNFARNVKCLECEEPRPKKQLTGGEWECPQCNFLNYSRNVVCLRCDCKRPGEVVANKVNSMSELGYRGNYVYKSNMDSKLIENEGKAKWWFGKGCLLSDASDVSSAGADEDFPEITPLRKGEKNFVVSTKRTPLERKLANSQNQKLLDSTSEGSASQSKDDNKSLDSSIRKSLDQILGCSSSVSGMDSQGITMEQKAPRDFCVSPRSTALGSRQPQASDPGDIPFVPSEEDMFCEQNHNPKVLSGEDSLKENCDIFSSSVNPQSNSVTLSSDSQKSRDSVVFAGKTPEGYTENDKRVEEQDKKSKRWFQRVEELHNMNNLHAIPDEDFPEIMPMRRGESRFLVSKKKDRSLTSPAYKRQVAVEQASNSNFVPFVPFPPGYFARKDAQEPVEGHSESSQILGNVPVKPDYVRPMVAESNIVQETGNLAGTSGEQNSNLSESNRRPLDENSSQNTISEARSSGCSSENGISKSMGLNAIPLQMRESQNNRSGWMGKSLEGSAAKEPDPIDMSEEAKAERWFRRVAQIKDISELSQIPDEDFPSIMPMRKGANRFVVSKRKTPLERRLTSHQYRRNPPTMSSDPMIEDDNSWTDG